MGIRRAYINKWYTARRFYRREHAKIGLGTHRDKYTARPVDVYEYCTSEILTGYRNDRVVPNTNRVLHLTKLVDRDQLNWPSARFERVRFVQYRLYSDEKYVCSWRTHVVRVHKIKAIHVFRSKFRSALVRFSNRHWLTCNVRGKQFWARLEKEKQRRTDCTSGNTVSETWCRRADLRVRMAV